MRDTYILPKGEPYTKEIHILPCKKWVRQIPVDAGQPIEKTYDYAIFPPTRTGQTVGPGLRKVIADFLGFNAQKDPRLEPYCWFDGRDGLNLFSEDVATVAFEYLDSTKFKYCESCFNL